MKERSWPNDVRKEWQLGIDPIPNMTSLLEDRGIKVLILPLPDGVSGLTASVRRPAHRLAVPVIVVNQSSYSGKKAAHAGPRARAQAD